MKRNLSIVITVFVFVVLAYLPVVPVSMARVVQNQTYSLRLVSFHKIISFSLNPWIGVSYRYPWYTFAVILALLAIGCLVSILVFRKIGGSSKS